MAEDDKKDEKTTRRPAARQQQKVDATREEAQEAAKDEGGEVSEFEYQTKALLARREALNATEPPHNEAMAAYSQELSERALEEREGVWTNPNDPPEKADLSRDPAERTEARDIDVKATTDAIEAGRTSDAAATRGVGENKARGNA